MNRHYALGAFLLFCFAIPSQGAGFDSARHKMVEKTIADATVTFSSSGISALSHGVIAAIKKVGRHRFVPSALTTDAHLNRPLPIDPEQAISQPSIVALMAGLMRLKPSEKVLGIGTNSGYQAAVLAEIAGAVYTIEIIEPPGMGDQWLRLGGVCRPRHVAGDSTGICRSDFAGGFNLCSNLCCTKGIRFMI